MIRPTRVIVDLGAIAHNIRVLKNHIGHHVRLMAVVKADAYGHGAVPVAGAALSSGVDWLGVALVEEGIRLRRAGLSAPVLILSGAIPQAADQIVRHNLTASVFTWESVLAMNQAAEAYGRKVPIHIKVDTGMGRIGLDPRNVLPFLEGMRPLRHLFVEGIFSHFASADARAKVSALRQLTEFKNLIASLDAQRIKIPLKHIANSAATIDMPESHMDMVRSGISIYGLYPSREVNASLGLVPAMTMATGILFIKEIPEGTPVSYGHTFVTHRRSRIATLPVGYGDGYPRLLSNQSRVLVCGMRAPVVGRICMDMTMIDVTDVPHARVGDEVILFGNQSGSEIGIDEIAEMAGTINYEITCGITKRVPRRYRRHLQNRLPNQKLL